MGNFKVTENKENPLFNRKEISFEVQANITPSRLETSKFFSEKFSVPVENIKIKIIKGKFGSNIFSGSVFIYNSEEDKNRVEIKKKKDKKMEEALKQKEPEKEPVEEKPKEEKATDADSNKSDNSKDGRKDNYKQSVEKGESLTVKESSEPQGEANSKN